MGTAKFPITTLFCVWAHHLAAIMTTLMSEEHEEFAPGNQSFEYFIVLKLTLAKFSVLGFKRRRQCGAAAAFLSYSLGSEAAP